MKLLQELLALYEEDDPKKAWDILLRTLILGDEEPFDIGDMYDGDDEELKARLAKRNDPLLKDPTYKKHINDPIPIRLVKTLLDNGAVITSNNAYHWAEDLMGGFGTTHHAYKPPKGSDHWAYGDLTDYVYRMFGIDVPDDDEDDSPPEKFHKPQDVLNDVVRYLESRGKSGDYEFDEVRGRQVGKVLDKNDNEMKITLEVHEDELVFKLSYRTEGRGKAVEHEETVPIKDREIKDIATTIEADVQSMFGTR